MNNITLGMYEVGHLLESYVVLESNEHASDYPANYFKTGILNKTGDNSYPCIVGQELKYSEDYINDSYVTFVKDKLSEMELSLKGHDWNVYKSLFYIRTIINWWLVEEAKKISLIEQIN